MSYMAAIERMPVEASFSIPPSFSALDTAMMLFTACPSKAKDFALAMYERAAWGFDTDKIEHWARIVMNLGQLAAMRQAE
jgi:hypothetical protein